MDLEEQYDKLYRYCYWKLRSREAAEDVTQETFLRFYADNGYAERGKAMAYLYTIARNLCMDEFRRRPTVPLETAGEPWEDREAETLLSLSVRAALDGLDEDERELLLLRYANDTPVATLAKLLGLSRFAVYRRTAQARQHLEQLLKEGEEEP